MGDVLSNKDKRYSLLSYENERLLIIYMIKKHAHNSLNISKDSLYDLYMNQGLSSTDIAKIYNCSHRAILNWLKRFNIPTRSLSESVKLNRSKWTVEQELARSRTYHNTWIHKSKEELDLISQKKSQNPNLNTPESIRKANQTRIQNGTSTQSKSETEFYHKLLIMGFDEDDIIHHYISTEYPFNCDFYIKSKDLYIEYQGHFTHGFAPFDANNTEHIAYLNKMQYRGVDMSTWIKRDVNKLNVAKENKINLLLVYPKHINYFVHDGQMTTIDINNINKI